MLGFYCIGAQKSGTTWLHNMLIQHPDIASTTRKEIHFWNHHHHLGLEWYNQFFTQTDALQGDITPAYAIIPPPKITECYKHFPNLKIIYILRDPLERIWSAFMMELHRQNHPPSVYPSDDIIHQFITREDTIARSMYVNCYQNWSSIYPKESFLLLHFADLTKAPRVLLNMCFKHLQIDPLDPQHINGLTHKPQKRKLNFEPHPMLVELLGEKTQNQWQAIQPHIKRALS